MRTSPSTTIGWFRIVQDGDGTTERVAHQTRRCVADAADGQARDVGTRDVTAQAALIAALWEPTDPRSTGSAGYGGTSALAYPTTCGKEMGESFSAMSCRTA